METIPAATPAPDLTPQGVLTFLHHTDVLIHEFKRLLRQGPGGAT